MTRINVPVYLPNWLYRGLRFAWHAIRRNSDKGLNLLGDRDIEWSFVAAHIPPGRGPALDFGSGGTYLSLIAAQMGYDVVALDLQPGKPAWFHPQVSFVQGDILQIEFPENHFELVINCSTVEHVGLAGRFSVSTEQPDGDLEAMSRLCRFLKADGVMLLTIPCGRDAVCRPWHRVYGEKRLPLLLRGFRVDHQTYWVKNSENRWIAADREAALSVEPSTDRREPFRSVYALGCFVLRKNNG